MTTVSDRDNTPKEEAAEPTDVAVKLQARSATIAAHSSNHAVLRNQGFAWR
ncbi:MAG: hypothetical protein S0880_06745 [Actinomycetota bacterium]|nr:hypothetical protein [Actinomycetota bacterium]